MARLLVTLLAALAIIAMPLSGGVAAQTTDIYQLARQSVSVTSDGFFTIKGGLSVSESARLHGVFDHLNTELSRVDRTSRVRHDLRPPGRSCSWCRRDLA